MYVHYYDIPLLNMFKAIKNTLVELSPLPKKSIVYSKFCSRVMYFQSKIGNYLDADDDINQHEVLVVHEIFPKLKSLGILSYSSIQNILVMIISMCYVTRAVWVMWASIHHISETYFECNFHFPPWILCKIMVVLAGFFHQTPSVTPTFYDFASRTFSTSSIVV